MASEPIRWTARLARLGAYLALRGRLSRGLAQGVMSAAAALIAYLPAKPLGLQEGFWGSITTIAVVQSELSATQSSARDQSAGAAIGAAIAGVTVGLAGTSLIAYALAVILSMTVCWLFNVPSAARLAGVTSTIVLLVPHRGSVAGMIISRVAEVGWGVAVGISVVWAVNRIEKAMRNSRAAASPPGP